MKENKTAALAREPQPEHDLRGESKGKRWLKRMRENYPLIFMVFNRVLEG